MYLYTVIILKIETFINKDGNGKLLEQSQSKIIGKSKLLNIIINILLILTLVYLIFKISSVICNFEFFLSSFYFLLIIILLSCVAL